MRNKRTNITLDGELLDVYQELADIRGIPRATLITEYLYTLQPHAQKTIEILRAKNESQVRANEMMNNVMAEANINLNKRIE